MLRSLGKYEILRPLGRGAMGEVFLAKDPLLGREVALKTIQAGSAFGAEAQVRFAREARATAALNHPNIVTVYDFGQEGDLAYLVMEYVDGESLEALIAQGLPKTDLLEALVQVCEGLGYAHERGVIHRDVKPANILVSRRGRRLQAKLMDFGLALVDQSTLTAEGVWMGTLSYMAPEYLDTGRASASSDLFALGVILYEILTGGRKPFTAETSTGILNAILRKPADPLAPEDARGLSPAILDVTGRALAKDPHHRFPSAEALAQGILGALNPEPAAPKKASPRRPPPALIVGKGGKATCLSLRVALRQAEPGARILVLPGVYRESVLLDKPVTLVGEGDPAETVIEGIHGPALRTSVDVGLERLSLRVAEGDAPALEVVSGRCTVHDCALAGAESPAAQVAVGASARFTRCRLEAVGERVVRVDGDIAFEDTRIHGGNRAGLHQGPGSRSTLQGGLFEDGPGVGLLLEATAQASLDGVAMSGRMLGGVELESEARLEARRCTFLASRFAGVLALDRGQILLEACTCSGHLGAGLHLAGGSSAQARDCVFRGNDGFGVSVQAQGLATLEGCEIADNGPAGLLIQTGATVQLRNCRILDGRGAGVVCEAHGRGVLEGCEIAGNARTGARVSPGGSLLLARCVIRDGQDTGLLLFQDAEATLEQCVVHRNARGGILLTRDAADPVLRGSNRIEDPLLREQAEGAPIRVAPVRKR